VPFLDFADHLELAEGGIERAAIRAYPACRSCRKVEDAAAHRKAALIPFGRGAVGVTPAIAGVVEGSGIDHRPVEKIGLGAVGVFVGVEHVGDREAPDPQHQAIGGLRAGELIDVRLQLLRVAAEIDGLAHESALHADIRIIGAEFVGFRTREAGDAVGVADPKALIDFRIEPEFGAFPESQTGEQRGVRRLSGLSAMR
jgi:hypothetical protein